MSSNREFLELQAIRNAGGKLSDFHDYYFGKIENNFLEFITAFYVAENLYRTHADDAIKIERERREKIERDKQKARSKTKTR